MVIKFTFTQNFSCIGASLVAQSVKNLPAVQETGVRSLNWEDPLGKEMATHSSILAWKLPGTEEPGGLTVHGGHKEWDTIELLHLILEGP